eukprot:gnl/TRDRNA2_/TRDRNA2_171361_c0_seq1.p1 gnl/TRDRNA2_/TRDRNA2_171361_c0~~gnl/TRDRNA2_/TRDRNA2_171361_c0_seq1.p1  ORF type:complete len:127 (+),score=14.73 gnl/TRDRNA2_/TRDRNA2_171361_c0_seq1:50-382(+)
MATVQHIVNSQQCTRLEINVALDNVEKRMLSQMMHLSNQVIKNYEKCREIADKIDMLDLLTVPPLSKVDLLTEPPLHALSTDQSAATSIGAPEIAPEAKVAAWNLASISI